MIKQALQDFLIRDVNKLKEEIIHYKNENDLWIVKGEVKNSAGNLTLHLIGNLNHFIGAQLGKTGYVRQRDNEFSSKNILKEKLISDIDNVLAVIQKTLSGLKDDDLKKEYPIEFLGKKLTVGEMLLQITTHLNYHLGQINYHRRLL